MWKHKIVILVNLFQFSLIVYGQQQAPPGVNPGQYQQGQPQFQQGQPQFQQGNPQQFAAQPQFQPQQQFQQVPQQQFQQVPQQQFQQQVPQQQFQQAPQQPPQNIQHPQGHAHQHGGGQQKVLHKDMQHEKE